MRLNLKLETPMPRFFFDIHDGTAHTPDPFGDEFDSVGQAREQVRTILADLLANITPDGGDRVLVCEVRDEAREVLHRGRLRYEGDVG